MKMNEVNKTESLADRFRKMELKMSLLEKDKDTVEKTKVFKWPWKWRRKFSQVKKKVNTEMLLVWFLNKKNEIEPPQFMPIYEGNMVIWKHKPYEFDPRAMWTIKGMKGNPRAYLIKEIDRRPVRNKEGKVVYQDAAVSNMDIEEIRERGDSTESDEFLIKAAIKAQISQAKKSISMGVIVFLILAVIGVVIYLMAS